MIILGVILLIIGLLVPGLGVLFTIGIIVLIIGLILLIIGQFHGPVGGRRYWYLRQGRRRGPRQPTLRDAGKPTALVSMQHRSAGRRTTNRAGLAPRTAARRGTPHPGDARPARSGLR